MKYDQKIFDNNFIHFDNLIRDLPKEGPLFELFNRHKQALQAAHYDMQFKLIWLKMWYKTHPIRIVLRIAWLKLIIASNKFLK